MLLAYLAVHARWMIGGVLLAAGVAKSRDVAEFVSTIQLFRILPAQLSRRWIFSVIARLIIGTELLLAACLLAGLAVELATAVAAVLFSIFTLAILVSLARHETFGCNCFGPYFREMIGAKAVIRNALLIVISLFVLRFYDGFLALDAMLFSRPVARSDSLGIFFLLTVALILLGIIISTAKIILKVQGLSRADEPR